MGEHLERRGFALEPFLVVEDMSHPGVTVAFPDSARFDLVVLMGSPWSVYDPRIQGWLAPELDLIRGHLRRGAPLLGICFGAQATSAALGGLVSHADRPEYGWGTVEPVHPAIAPGPWFQFHHDQFTLPPGATELARNQSGVQAFRAGPGLAVQFHPEITPSLLASWCAAGGDRPLRDAGLDPDQVIEESARLADEAGPNLDRMLDWWLQGRHDRPPPNIAPL